MARPGEGVDRLELLLALRADPDLQQQQVDNRQLREIIDDLESYVHAWNDQLQRIYMRDRRELIAAHDRAADKLRAAGRRESEADQHFQEILDAIKIRRRELPLSAIREIAVAVASQKDSRHPLLRKLVPFNPVAARHRELRQRYNAFVEQPGAARTEMERSFNDKSLPDKLSDMYKLLEQAANEILQREVLLRDLASAGRSLADSAATPGLLENRTTPRHSLTPQRIRTLARYFGKQAAIEELRFKTLHLASQRFYRLHYPEKQTKRLHGQAMRAYGDSGYSHYTHRVTLKAPTI